MNHLDTWRNSYSLSFRDNPEFTSAFFFFNVSSKNVIFIALNRI